MSFDGEQQEDDEINSVLWVGNLDSKVTEAMLYELFFQAGPIKHIKIPKGNDGAVHKGYCFIHFHHEASVPYTINIMDGTSLFGRRLKLQPRPGSVHRKIMDQKQIVEQRQGQELMLQQQQQQWFAQPQLAQIPNMFVYQNQMLQPYSPQNLNVNMPLSFQPQLAHQVMQIQMPQQPVQPAAQPLVRSSAYQATAPRAQSQPRQPHHQQQQQQQITQVNGYAPYMSGMSSQQPRSVNPNVAASAAPSHFSQAANGPPLFQQHQPRGPRPRHSGQHHNGQAMVNGNRMSYNQRAPLLQSLPQQQQQQQQQLFYNPMYQPQPMPVVTAATAVEPQFQLNGNQNLHEPQYYHRRPHQPPAMPPGVPANPTNGFQNVQLYHY